MKKHHDIPSLESNHTNFYIGIKRRPPPPPDEDEDIEYIEE